jgi:hypothetical protein
MDQLMWVVTFIALSLAVGMSVLAVRLLRGDRRRSAARVAALEAAAFEIEDEAADDVPPFEAEFEPLLEPALNDFRGELRGEFCESDVAMFAATEEPKAPPRRWLALAAVALVMAGLAGTGYVLFKPTPLGASAAAAPTAPATTAVSPVSHAGPPIELLSLKHTTDGATFTVAGLVQNPIDGATFTRVVAVVYLFDKDGAYFATGRADLEFTGLRPGEESPFTIRIPETANVSRYRVGFRREDGSVIAHVDKRGQATAALMTEGKH